MSFVLAAFDPRAFRWGSSHAPVHETLAIVAAAVGMALLCALGVWRLGTRDRRRRRVADQWQALAVMGELCPAGWEARITVYGGGAPAPDDAPAWRVPPVELEWRRFDGVSRGPAETRRLWAPSIGAALQAMAEERQADRTGGRRSR